MHMMMVTVIGIAGRLFLSLVEVSAAPKWEGGLCGAHVVVIFLS